MDIEIKVADAGTWADVETVMGPTGASSGCWCMFWRLTNQANRGRTAEDNRAALCDLVTSAAPTGVLAYRDGTPVGWCQVAPRDGFPRLFHTKGLELADPQDASVWAIVCVYVTRAARGTGVSGALVQAAVGYAAGNGATVVEGYPVGDAGTGRKTQLSSGTVGLFERAGFTLAAPIAGRRAVVRRRLT